MGESKAGMVLAIGLVAVCAVGGLVIGVIALVKDMDTVKVQVDTGAGAGAGAGSDGDSAGSNAPRTAEDGKRLFNVQIEYDWGAHAYVDAQGYIKGFSSDVVNAVCEAADVHCKLIYDDNANCFRSITGKPPVGGQGLLDGWYDACSGWAPTVNRIAIFGFGDPYLNPPKSNFFVKKGDTSFDPADITGKKIGFVNGWTFDDKCIARQTDIAGSTLPDGDIMNFDSADAVVAALLDDTVHAISGDSQIYARWLADVGSDEIEAKGEFVCVLAGHSAMSRKDSDFLDYWNKGMKALQDSGDWTKLCEEAVAAHGTHGAIPCV